MKQYNDRRDFIRTATMPGIGTALSATALPLFGIAEQRGSDGQVVNSVQHKMLPIAILNQWGI